MFPFRLASLAVVSIAFGSEPTTPLPPPFLSPRLVRAAPAKAPDSLRILSWNIDRGSHFPQVLQTLKRLQPDILLLQEVDSGTSRVGGRDVAHDLATALRMSETFGVEFEELGQEKDRQAYTGQATLSRLAVREARILRFENQSGFWKPHAWLPSNVPLLQRRLGSRIALVSELEFQGKLLVVYNLHLESRSYGRIQVEQLDEVLADLASHYPPTTAVLLGGDLNTKYFPSFYLHKLERVGFHNATGKQIERTHTIAMALDWLFTRGLPAWEQGNVDKTAVGSDHYPVTAVLSARHD